MPVRSISLGACRTISAVFEALADLHPAEEMQQKFGEDSIWVYEILRYAHVTFGWKGDNRVTLLRGIDRTEGAFQETVSCPR